MKPTFQLMDYQLAKLIFQLAVATTAYQVEWSKTFPYMSHDFTYNVIIEIRIWIVARPVERASV